MLVRGANQAAAYRLPGDPSGQLVLGLGRSSLVGQVNLLQLADGRGGMAEHPGF